MKTTALTCSSISPHPVILDMVMMTKSVLFVFYPEATILRCFLFSSFIVEIML